MGYADDDDSSGQPAAPTSGVVSWSPPTQNWNPWTGCNIDEGPLAVAALEDISQDLLRGWSEQRQMNKVLLEVGINTEVMNDVLSWFIAH